MPKREGPQHWPCQNVIRLQRGRSAASSHHGEQPRSRICGGRLEARVERRAGSRRGPAHHLGRGSLRRKGSHGHSLGARKPAAQGSHGLLDARQPAAQRQPWVARRASACGAKAAVGCSARVSLRRTGSNGRFGARQPAAQRQPWVALRGARADLVARRADACGARGGAHVGTTRLDLFGARRAASRARERRWRLRGCASSV